MSFHNKKDFQEQHDLFVRHYNKAENKLSAIAELRTIQQAVEEYVSLESAVFRQGFEHMLNGLRVDEMSWLPEAKKEEIRSQVVPYLNFQSIKVMDAVDWLENTKEAYAVYYKTVLGGAEWAAEDMKIIEEDLQGIYRAMLKGFHIGNIINSAIRKDFPLRLPRLQDLSEGERQELTAKIGAPMSEDVPQDRVQAIVDNLFSEQGKGRVIVEVDGEKQAYQIIHQNGKWEGKANVNQIYKCLVTVHPDLDRLTDRQLKERIKKALPDEMK